MCIICLEFDRLFDIADARQMISAARKEPGVISEAHLKEVEKKIADYEKKSQQPWPYKARLSELSAWEA